MATLMDDRELDNQKSCTTKNHGRDCGSGNRPMTSWCAAGACMAGGGAAGAVGGNDASADQDSKKRRSAISWLGATTRPTLVQRRRRLQRRSVPASHPTRTAIRTPTANFTTPDTPSAQSAAWIAP